MNSSSADSSSDDESLSSLLLLRGTFSFDESSSEESSSEERSNNRIPNTGQNKSIKRRYISASEEDTSEENSLVFPRPIKVIKQSNEVPSENDFSGNAKQAEPITVQNCRHCCSICDEEYNHTTRCPLCLPCGHTFCSGCLRGVENSGSRRCPMCRGDFGVDMVAGLQPCFQLIPGNDLLASVKPSVQVVPKTQNLAEGTVWRVEFLNQLLEVEHALNSSSVRPKEVAIVTSRDSEVPLLQMKLFLDLMRRTRCAVNLVLLDSFIDPTKMRQERDEQFLKGLLKGRCQVVEFWGYHSRNILKHLDTLGSLKTLGFGLIDSSDVRAIVCAMDKQFMETVATMHVSISMRMNLNNITKKIDVPPNKRCVVHFCGVDDDDVNVIPKTLDALFTTNSSMVLQLHRVHFSLRGADTLLGVMRDLGIRKAAIESLCLKPNEKKILDYSCKKFNCRMVWT